MKPEIKEVLQELRERKKKAEIERREKMILKFDLKKKVYLEEGEDTSSAEKEIVTKDGKEVTRYFTRVPMDLSDLTEEEVRALDEEWETIPVRNRIGSTLKGIGILFMAAGFILGIVLGSQERNFDFAMAGIAWGSGFLSGMIFLGFSEIIRILHDLRHTLNEWVKKKRSGNNA